MLQQSRQIPQCRGAGKRTCPLRASERPGVPQALHPLVLYELQPSIVGIPKVILSQLCFPLLRYPDRVSTGMTGPLGFGLGLRDSALVITFFGLATSVVGPFFCVFGAKLGLRQMVVARYSFGQGSLLASQFESANLSPACTELLYHYASTWPRWLAI